MKLQRALWLPVVAILWLLSTGVWSATIYVDGVKGDDEADGTTVPFNTIGRALRSLRPGDTLSLAKMDRPYRECLRVTVGGLPGQPLVIEGNGATLCGADPAPKAGWEAKGDVFVLPQEAEVKFVYGPEVRYSKATAADKLQPEQWFWEKGLFHFRPAAGKSIQDYDLELTTTRDCGFAVAGPGFIVVRNLTCEHFWNDGFNIHSGSAPVWFENIRGVWNGDEGFSAHENCECYVRGAYLAHNFWHGIADVNLCRTHYTDVTIENNVYRGILIEGGVHSFTDCRVSGSPVNIALTRGGPLADFPQAQSHPFSASVTNLRNVSVQSQGDEVGLSVGRDSTLVMEHCALEGGSTALSIAPAGKAFVVNSILSADRTTVSSGGSYVADRNVYFPGRFSIAGKVFEPEAFGAYQQETGNDRISSVQKVQYAGMPPRPIAGSAARGTAFAKGYGGPDIGLEIRGALEGLAAVEPSARSITATGRELLRYDFERANPWSLVYPVPETNQAGMPVQGVSELSAEQAHSGTSAANLTVKLPSSPPSRYMIKLFSLKMPYGRPVQAVRFWLYGDGSGKAYRLRVRDAGGECFYAPAGTMTWSGWKQIVWDLEATPPQPISQGDGNHVQDCPPLEIVLEVDVTAGPEGGELCLWVDDLEVELAPRR